MTQVHVAPPGGWTHEPINPDRWADNMLRAWKVATYYKGIGVAKRSVSLSDVDNADPGELVNTPRSLQACLLLGIDPSEIEVRSLDYFTERGLSKELQELKYQYHEKERSDKVARLIEERERIIKEHDTNSIFIQDGKVLQHGGEGGGKAMGAAQAKVNAKAENQARRAAKEKEKKKKLEKLKKEMEANAEKIAAQQAAKQAAQKAEKARKDKEFAAQMYQSEQRKAKEEEELEKEARRLGEKRYQEEIDLAKERAIAAKKAKKAAITKEKERAKKQEEFRIQLEKIQESIAKAAAEKTKELQAKEAERRRLQEIKKKELAEVNALNRAEAEKRQAAALATWLRMLQKKKDDYDAKCAAQRVRRKEKMLIWKRQQAEKKEAEEKKERDRLQTLQNAIELREKRAQVNIAKANKKSQLLKAYLKEREKQRRRDNTERNLQSSAQYWRCQAVARKQALHRKQILDQIEKETAKVRALLDSKLQVAKDRQLRQAKELWGHTS